MANIVQPSLILIDMSIADQAVVSEAAPHAATPCSLEILGDALFHMHKRLAFLTAASSS